MRTIKIGNKEYTIEYSIEASLYADCTEKVTHMFKNISGAGSKEGIENFIKAMSDVPQTTLSMFHAGLLENEKDWDMSKTKAVVKQYLSEHKEDGTGNFYSLMEILIEEMEKDGFFELIGLDKMLAPTTKQPKIPQDHKKKQNATKVTES